MKRLSVITKAEANLLALSNSHRYQEETYSMGKYIWFGCESVYVGKQHTTPDRVAALWVEKKTDELGDYATFKCLIDLTVLRELDTHSSAFA